MKIRRTKIRSIPSKTLAHQRICAKHAKINTGVSPCLKKNASETNGVYLKQQMITEPIHTIVFWRLYKPLIKFNLKWEAVSLTTVITNKIKQL